MNTELTSVHADKLKDCLKLAEEKQNGETWELVNVFRDVGGRNHYAAILKRQMQDLRSNITITRNFVDLGVDYAVGDVHSITNITLIRIRSQYPGRFTEDPLDNQDGGCDDSYVPPNIPDVQMSARGNDDRCPSSSPS